MTVVELGTNLFVDCRALIGFRGTDLLVLKTRPLRVSLRVPSEDNETNHRIEIVDGMVQSGEGISVKADAQSVAIYSSDALLLVALLRDENTIHLKLDLRPLGLQIFDDASGLHIGTAIFGKNTIANASVAVGLA